ncbi:MAG: S8 family serine peptidase, partial [Dehalococcoidia bacterium]
DRAGRNLTPIRPVLPDGARQRAIIMRLKLLSPFGALLLALAVLATLAIADGGEPVARADSRIGDYAAGELIVSLEDGAAANAHATVSSVSGASVKRISSSGAFASVSVPAGDEDEYIALLSGLSGVTTVERNPLAQPAFVPNDEFYESQWNLPMIQAEEAWDITMGEGVTVAVLDTGVAFEDFGLFAQAPDLAETQFVDPYDATFGDKHPSDEDGHGTHVTGTIAQSTDNGEGAAGVAPDVAIMPVKVCVFLGCPGFAIADGVNWAVDHGADIINMSLGGDTISQAERDAFDYAEENGVFVVAAAVDTVFSVGAVRLDQTLAPYSNFGAGDSGGIDIVAPGGDTGADQDEDGFIDGVLQNTYAYTCGAGPFGFDVFDYCFYQGTSMATPHVAGVAALLLSEHPDLTVEEVREVLRCSALDLGLPGYDEQFGAGLVQAADALSDTDLDGTVDCLDDTLDPLPPLVGMQSVTVDEGEEVTVSLNVEVRAPGLSAFSIDVAFDPGVVELVSCDELVFALCNADLAPGVARLSGVAIPSIEGPAVLVDMTFRAVGEPGSTSPLDVQLIDFADGNLEDLVPMTVVTDGEIAIADTPVEEPPLIPSGDVDCDNDVDAVDALFVLKSSASFGDPDCIVAGDVDCDADVDAVDALKIAQHVANIPVTLPQGCAPIGSAG